MELFQDDSVTLLLPGRYNVHCGINDRLSLIVNETVLALGVVGSNLPHMDAETARIHSPGMPLNASEGRCPRG